MADTIRSLFVKLAYDVDTTGADRFNSSFDRLTGTLNKVGRNYGKTIDRMRDKNRLFVITAGDVANAIGKIAKAGKKIFLAFSDIQQARVELGFVVGTEEADRLIESVAKITKETGGYITQLEALNSIAFAGNITDQMGFFEKNLGNIIKLSKVIKPSFKETTEALARFIATGEGLDKLVEFQVISASQKEALVKQGAAKTLTDVGIETRTSLAQVSLDRIAARVDTSFEEYEKTGGAALDKFAATLEETQTVVGSVLNPAIVEVAKGLTESTGNIKESLEKNGSFIDAWTASFNTDAAKSMIKFFGGVTGKKGGGVQENLSFFERTFSGKKETTGPGSQSTTVNQTNTVTVNAGNADAEEVGKIVESKLSQQATRINQAQAGKTIPKAVNAHVQAAQ